MKIHVRLIALMGFSVFVSACTGIPPLEPIARKEKEPPPMSYGVITLPLHEALAKYGQPDYAIDPDEGIDMNTLVHLDTRLPWRQAMRESLSEIGLEVVRPGAGKRAQPAKVTVAVKNQITPISAVEPQPAKVVAASVPAAPAVVQSCVLSAGAMIRSELDKCGAKTGWKVIWNLEKDWVVPALSTFEGEFPEAAGKVIETMASQGAVLRAKFYDGNKTMVVTPAGMQ